jgi:hypothetical protein
MVQQSLVGQGFFTIEASRSQSDTLHTVGLLWTGDQPDTETPTWQQKHSQGRGIHAPGEIRTRNHSKRKAADPRLRRRGHSFRLTEETLHNIIMFPSTLKMS